MSFACISFQNNRLSKSVCVLRDPLHIIKCCQKRILRLTSEIHRNTPCNKLRHFFTLIWIVHNFSKCNRSILPVNLCIVVHITCNDHFHFRHFRLFYRILHSMTVFDISMIIPGRTCKSHRLIVSHIFRSSKYTRILTASGYYCICRSAFMF